jgi:hypothetical protein
MAQHPLQHRGGSQLVKLILVWDSRTLIYPTEVEEKTKIQR